MMSYQVQFQVLRPRTTRGSHNILLKQIFLSGRCLLQRRKSIYTLYGDFADTELSQRQRRPYFTGQGRLTGIYYKSWTLQAKTNVHCTLPEMCKFKSSLPEIKWVNRSFYQKITSRRAGLTIASSARFGTGVLSSPSSAISSKFVVVFPRASHLNFRHVVFSGSCNSWAAVLVGYR